MTILDVYYHALSFFGTPYQWGGQGNGFEGSYGFDCSGYVRHILAYAGVQLPHPENMNAHNLYLYFQAKGINSLRGMGTLAFFGDPEEVSHVGWMIDDRIMLSSAGGGSNCTSLIVAKHTGAGIKIQPLAWYKFPALVACYTPSYPINCAPQTVSA